MGGDTRCSVAKVNLNRNVPELWNDNGQRKLNLNWFDNDWNANYRFLGVRHSYFSPFLMEGVFCTCCRFHAPNIRPTSSRTPLIWVYFFVSRNLDSQARSKRIFTRSTRDIALSIKIIFSEFLE